mmetsp:Transcript_7783/g.28225  ORF Transcript_7783/g.28225 Transcript_7783/m.28225 type:complete len:209 (-) Transcript_7783:994-1620(-)
MMIGAHLLHIETGGDFFSQGRAFGKPRGTTRAPWRPTPAWREAKRWARRSRRSLYCSLATPSAPSGSRTQKSVYMTRRTKSTVGRPWDGDFSAISGPCAGRKTQPRSRPTWKSTTALKRTPRRGPATCATAFRGITAATLSPSSTGTLRLSSRSASRNPPAAPTATGGSPRRTVRMSGRPARASASRLRPVRRPTANIARSGLASRSR